MKKITPHGLGWQPDLPDMRDLHLESPKIRKVLDKSRSVQVAAARPPRNVDLSSWCSPIEDQGQLGSCTANAGVGLFEYFQRRAYGRYVDGSRLFLYKATRNLLGLSGDTGAYLRSTMGGMRLFGIPPESQWPYDIASFDEEPPAFCYAFAQNFQALLYYRLDGYASTQSEVLDNVKRSLAAGLPSMFGFTVYNSIWDAPNGEIPFPEPGEYVEGGHAIVAIGYDDDRQVGKYKGALKIRNSWGTSWGQQGYGWMPYEYILRGIAEDFWSLVNAEFVDTELFTVEPRWALAPQEKDIPQTQRAKQRT